MGKISSWLISVSVGILLAFVLVPPEILEIGDWLSPVYGPNIYGLLVMISVIIPGYSPAYIICMSIVIALLSRKAKDSALVGFLFSISLLGLTIVLGFNVLSSVMSFGLGTIPPHPDMEKILQYSNIPMIGQLLQIITTGPFGILLVIPLIILILVMSIFFIIFCVILSAIMGYVIGYTIAKVKKKQREDSGKATPEEIVLIMILVMGIFFIPHRSVYPPATKNNEDYMEVIDVYIEGNGNVLGILKVNDSANCNILPHSTFIIFECGGDQKMITLLLQKIGLFSTLGFFTTASISLPSAGIISSSDANISYGEGGVIETLKNYGLEVKPWPTLGLFSGYNIYADVNNTSKNYLYSAINNLKNNRGGFALHILDTPPENASWVRLAGVIANGSISAYLVGLRYYYTGNETHTFTTSLLWNGGISFGNASYSGVRIKIPTTIQSNITGYQPSNNPIPYVSWHECTWEGSHLTGTHEYSVNYIHPHPLKLNVSRVIIGELKYGETVTVKITLKNEDIYTAKNVSIDDSSVARMLSGRYVPESVANFSEVPVGENVSYNYTVQVWSGGIFWINRTYVTHSYGEIDPVTYTIDYGDPMFVIAPRVPFYVIMEKSFPGGYLGYGFILAIGIVLQVFEIYKAQKKREATE